MISLETSSKREQCQNPLGIPKKNDCRMRSPSSWMIFPSILIYSVYILYIYIYIYICIYIYPSLSLSRSLSITIYTIIIYERVFNDSSRIPTNPRVTETLKLDISTSSKIQSNHHILKYPKKWFF